MIFAGIADDVTGGMELAALLAGQGVDCGFVTTPDLVRDGGEAVVIAQKSRTCPAADSVAATLASAEAARTAGARQIFFKYCATFDSTPDGNIGPCADALRERTGSALTLFVPSFPEAGRFVFQGHLFVGDRLVSESAKRFDPLTPMTDPDLVRVLRAQTARTVGLVSLATVRQGRDALVRRCAALEAEGVAYAIADAVADEDLAALAELTVGWPLMTGNSTVAGFYPSLWRRLGLIGADRGPPSLPPVDGPGVVLAGSCAERTLEQLAVFGRERPVIFVDPVAAAEGDPVPGVVERVLPLLAEGPVAIATSAGPDDVARSQSALGVRGAAAVAEHVLSTAAAQLRARGVRRFLVAGGETSGAILEALGVRTMRVGRYEAAGVGRAVSEGPDPLALCLKSGKLGPLDMFLPVLDRMRTGGV